MSSTFGNLVFGPHDKAVNSEYEKKKILLVVFRSVFFSWLHSLRFNKFEYGKLQDREAKKALCNTHTCILANAFPVRHVKVYGSFFFYIVIWMKCILQTKPLFVFIFMDGKRHTAVFKREKSATRLNCSNLEYSIFFSLFHFLSTI